MRVSRAGRVEKLRTKGDGRDRLMVEESKCRQGIPDALCYVVLLRCACVPATWETALVRLGVEAKGQPRRHGRGKCC
jgi:hypothetical protein